jgi:hypothetical protein
MFGKPSKGSGNTRGLFYMPRFTNPGGIYASDNAGYIFNEFFIQFDKITQQNMAKMTANHPDDAVNNLIQNYDFVAVILDYEGNKICYSLRPANRLPTEFTDRVRSVLDIMPNDTVLWADDVFNTPQEATAREVIFGQKAKRSSPPHPPRPPSKASLRKEAEKRWAHPDALSKDELDFLMGKKPRKP